MGLSSETQEQGVPFVKGGHDFPTGVIGVGLILRGKGIETGSEVAFYRGSLSPAKVLLLWRGWEWTLGATGGWISATLEAEDNLA